jgi:hypothetical protein
MFPDSYEINKQTVLQCQYNITEQIQELTEGEKNILEEKYKKRIMESTGNKKETNKNNSMNRQNTTTSSSTMNRQKQTTPQIISQHLAKLFPNKIKRKRTYQSTTSSSTMNPLNSMTSSIKTKTPVKNNKKMYRVRFQEKNGIDTVDLVPENLIKKIEKQVTSRTRSGNVKKQLEIGDRVKVIYHYLGRTKPEYHQGELIAIYSQEKK